MFYSVDVKDYEGSGASGDIIKRDMFRDDVKGKDDVTADDATGITDIFDYDFKDEYYL